MKEKVSHGIAIVGLILNIIIWPGLGTLICKKYVNGIIQMIIYIVAFILFLIPLIQSLFLEEGEMVFFFTFYLGLLIAVGVWIWALVDSITILKKSK